jgi:hypothetical protein
VVNKVFWKKLFPHGERIQVPLLLFWITLLCYGLYVTWFGFFGDDWSYIYYHHLLGFRGPGDFASADRPLSALFYNPVIALLGETPLPYHLFLCLLRWLSAVLFWWILKEIWPGKQQTLAWAALLFAVFPGFRQQPIAVEFILHFAVLDLFLLSILLMIWAHRSAKWYGLLTAAAMVSCGNIFLMEYFVGLELMRPLIIWGISGGREKNIGRRLFRTLIAWLPYLAVMAAFIFWRVFIFQFPTYQPTLLQDLLHSPLQGGLGLIKTILLSLKAVTLNSWRVTLNFPQFNEVLPYLVIVLICFITITVFFTRVFRRKEEENGESKPFAQNWGFRLLVWGGIAFLASGWPFWLTGIPVEASFPWDRSLLPMIPGACLMALGMIEFAISWRLRPILLAMMVALAVGAHFINAQVYREEWQNTRAFIWQLAWRAPGLKTGTIVVSDDIPLFRVSDNGLTSTLNWTYAPDNHSRQIPYKFFDLTLRLNEEYSGLPGLEKDLPVTHDYRTLFFASTTSNLLVFHYNPRVCLRVLFPDDINLAGLPAKVAATIPLSNQGLILVNNHPPAHPPEEFGLEPEHGWCYFYQKAELARQVGDWQTVTSLGDEADKMSLAPLNPSELLPFIEGYAYRQSWKKARELSFEVSRDETLRKTLCSRWQKIKSDPIIRPEERKVAEGIMGEIACEN